MFSETYDGDHLISDDLYHAIILHGAKIDHLLHVIDYKTIQELPFYHLKSNYYFPKMRKDSVGLITEDQCPTCMQNGFYDDVPLGGVGFIRIYKYNYKDIKDILPMSDVFCTWEHIGASNLTAHGNKVVRYARPRFIIKEKIKKILEDLKVKKSSI